MRMVPIARESQARGFAGNSVTLFSLVAGGNHAEKKGGLYIRPEKISNLSLSLWATRTLKVANA